MRRIALRGCATSWKQQAALSSCGTSNLTSSALVDRLSRTWSYSVHLHTPQVMYGVQAKQNNISGILPSFPFDFDYRILKSSSFRSSFTSSFASDNCGSRVWGITAWKLESLGFLRKKIWVFPKIGVRQNGWTKWKTLLKWMIWGYPYFWKYPYTLLETKIAKIGCPKRNFIFQPLSFRGYVSFREGINATFKNIHQITSI